MVEIASVLLVISAIVIGVVASDKISRQSELNSIIEDAATIREAIMKFKSIYGTWPGDLSDISRLPFTNANTVAGDGNGYIDLSTNEHTQVLHQLYLAGLITPKITKTTLSDGNIIATSGVEGSMYPSSIKDVGYIITTEVTGTSTKNPGLYLRANKVVNGTLYGFLTPQELQDLDNKFDDGNADTGGIFFDVQNILGSGCIDGLGFLNLSSKSTDCGAHVNLVSLSIPETTNSSTTLSTLTCAGSRKIGKTDSSNLSGWLCPEGFTGNIPMSCSVGRLLYMSRTYCRPMQCYGGGYEGDTRTIECPAGYSGQISQTCRLGNWVYTGWGINATPAFPCLADIQKCNGTQVRVLACPLGYKGYVKQTCSANSWSITTNTCTRMTCGNDAYGTTGTFNFGSSTLIKGGGTNLCTTVNGTNYTSNTSVGGISQICTYGATDSTLISVSSPSLTIVNDNCYLGAAACTGQVGATRTLPCKKTEIGIKGTVTQVCNVNGLWQTTENLCEPKTCGGAPLGSIRLNTRGKTCPTVTVGGVKHREMALGTVVEVCRDPEQPPSGAGTAGPPTWELDYSNCVNTIS